MKRRELGGEWSGRLTAGLVCIRFVDRGLLPTVAEDVDALGPVTPMEPGGWKWVWGNRKDAGPSEEEF